MNLSVIRKKFAQFPILFVCGVITPLALVLLIMRGPKVTQYENELSELEKEWNNIQVNVERSSGLQDDITTVEAALQNVNERLMNVDNKAVNYEFFYDLERQTGVNLKQFSHGDASFGEALPIGQKSLRHFSVIPYDLQMTGSLEEILDFVDLLDRQDYIVRVDSLKLTNPPAAEKERGGVHMLSCRLSCHVLAEKHE